MKMVQITRELMPYGSVLLVDDVETNIYVARGLMSPYGLNIDSASSGFAAIDKVKNGKVYDIIFMDHMMPVMDGVEATKIIRDFGYKHPIVALTANAVAGQADIFLGNGFDDYISKPIDIRQLNAILNKLIRDKQPPEVIEALRQQMKPEGKQPSGGNEYTIIDPFFAEIFVRDAERALAVLEAIYDKNDYSNEEYMRTFIINVHGMKSALANVGKMDLSAVALKLEAAGREGKIDMILSETPAFLSSLRAFVEAITPRKKAGDGEMIVEDKQFLFEKLLEIKAACEEFDENAADEALKDLRKKVWNQETEDMLVRFSGEILHCDFDEIIEEINGLTME